MKNQGRVIFAGVCLISIVLVVTARPVFAALALDAEAGRLALVNGDVRIAKDDKDKGLPAKPNDPIKNSDVIKTGPDATAKMLFTDQSVMDIGPNSALQISNYALKDGDNRTGSFNLFYGKLRALVTRKVGESGKVEVRTSEAVMGVRGTEFMVDTPKPRGGLSLPTSLVVASGTVSVTPPQGGSSFSVGAGQMMQATAATLQKAQGSSTSSAAGGDAGGSGGFVKQVSTEQIQAFASTTATQDNTFKNEVTIVASNGNARSAGENKSPMMPEMTPPPPPPRLPPPTPPGGGPTAPLGPPVSVPVGNPVHLSVTVQ